MKKKVKVQDLKIGMRVHLPAAWLNHPFIKNRFTISSYDQIQKIIDSGFKEVITDVSPSDTVTRGPISEKKEYIAPPKEWEPEQLIPAELREAIHDKTLSPEKKAAIVYQSALKIMTRLLEDPKAGNIREAKKGIANIVDLIVSDDATSKNLLSITSHDFYTYTHSVNVGVLSVLLSKVLFKDSYAHDMHELGSGFFLHDIGKVRIDPDILNKPAKLTDEEMNEVRKHPFLGYKTLLQTKQLSEECRIIVMHHHEREDGTGYPNHLKGKDIHVYGRICSIADVYDALTSERPYKHGLPPFDALKLMKEQMLNHFGQDLFDKFVLLFA
jgi:HD-GYP domain-containing protein (c-di-GMP phosphodiesterase class II)